MNRDAPRRITVFILVTVFSVLLGLALIFGISIVLRQWDPTRSDSGWEGVKSGDPR